MKEEKRLITFDFLKFIAIFMVLWGHALQYFFSGNYYDNMLYRIIYSVHMPLFMTILGFFAAKLNNIEAREALRKKFRQLVLPTLTFGILYCILDCYLNHWGVNIILGKYIYCFWFLKSAMLCCLLYILSRYFKYPVSYFGIIITLLLSQCIILFKVNLMYPCFIMGVVLKKNYEYVKNKTKALTIFSCLFYLVLLYFWNASFWVIPEINGKFIYNPFRVQFLSLYRIYYRIILGFVGSLFFLCLTEMIFKNLWHKGKLITCISFVGQETLGIYLLQVFILERMAPYYLQTRFEESFLFDFVITPLISIFIMVLCLAFTNALKRNIITAYLAFGK